MVTPFFVVLEATEVIGMTGITAGDLNRLIQEGQRPQLVDVREYSEFAGCHIEGSVFAPLSELKKNVGKIDRNQTTYLICRMGNRATQAAKRLESLGIQDTAVLTGGLKSWIEGGFAVREARTPVWSLERQVRFAAGALVLSGILLSWVSHPFFVGISLFVAAGLIFSAITDTCGMAMILAKFPWNKAKRET